MSLCQRMIAGLHQPIMRQYERYIADRKKSLFANLPETILEIGPGVGSNLSYLPTGANWIGCEPNRHMHAQLLAKADSLSLGSVKILSDSAEALPVDDDSVDAVICTLVLCSVTNVRQSLAEIVRVLKPGGRFFFIEHVAAPPRTWTSRLQSIMHYPWRLAADGCHTNRETSKLIAAGGFAKEHEEHFSVPSPMLPPFLAPHISGWAQKEPRPKQSAD